MTGGMVPSSAFGLRVWSNQPIPGLPPLPEVAGIDVRVWLGVMPALSGSGGGSASQVFYASGSHSAGEEPVLRVWRVAGGKYFRFQYRDGTEFLIEKSGSEVWGTWPEPWTVEDTAVYLLGPVFGFLLRLRGGGLPPRERYCSRRAGSRPAGTGRCRQVNDRSSVRRVGLPRAL